MTDTDSLNDFQECQWWIATLDEMANSNDATSDQKRAVAVVHNMLRAARAQALAEYPPLPTPYLEQGANPRGGEVDCCCYTADQMRAHYDLGRASTAQAPEPRHIDLLRQCRDFIDTTTVPAFPAGAELADEIDNLLDGPEPTAVEPVASFEDPRVQTVYEFLCSDERPPSGEHWEGFAARRIVDALAAPADALDAARYRNWRDVMLADSGLEIIAEALPNDVGVTRRPTASEWDAAIDAIAAIAAQAAQKNGGV